MILQRLVRVIDENRKEKMEGRIIVANDEKYELPKNITKQSYKRGLHQETRVLYRVRIRRKNFLIDKCFYDLKTATSFLKWVNK